MRMVLDFQMRSIAGTNITYKQLKTVFKFVNAGIEHNEMHLLQLHVHEFMIHAFSCDAFSFSDSYPCH